MAGLRAREAELARVARSGAVTRLRLGELLVELVRIGGHHELGFSSFEAYAFERVARSGRWARDTKRLAHQLQSKKLHLVRAALRSGQIAWSVAELLARHATAEDEAELLAEARGRTVAGMRAWLSTRDGSGDAPVEDDDDEPTRTASRTAGYDELQILEATRALVELLCSQDVSDEAFIDALLGEAQSTLQSIGERTVLRVALPDDPREELRRALREARAADRRRPATAPRLPPLPLEDLDPLDHTDGVGRDLPRTPHALDADIRRLAHQLAVRDLRLGELAGPFFAVQGWRLFGFDRPAAYAKDRLGLSLSSLQHRAGLARRTEALPELKQALTDGRLGYEAALLVARVARPTTARAWVERAQRRTVVHLKEEVNAVRTDAILAGKPDFAPLPPDDAVLARVAELRAQVVDGSYLDAALSGLGPQTSVTFAAGHEATARFRISEDLWLHFQFVEKQFRTVASRDASFLAFACFSFWQAWLPTLEAHDVKWKEVYVRDHYQCTSPVCRRRDVTPHHLKFKGHGGGDELENMTTLCPWCHLHGIHEGRITARPPAAHIRWTFGRDPLLAVDGRDKVELDEPQVSAAA